MGIKFLFTICIVVTCAISDVAIKTPETGETVLPIDAAKFIGKINSKACKLKRCVISGASGPKEKKAAFPLPIIIADKKISITINTPIPIATSPIFSQINSNALMKFNDKRPDANMSATIINVTTVLKIFPMPDQNTLKESIISFKFLLKSNSNIIAIKTLMNIADDVSKIMGELKIFEKIMRRIIGKIGMMQYTFGTLAEIVLSFSLIKSELCSLESKYLFVK